MKKFFPALLAVLLACAQMNCFAQDRLKNALAEGSPENSVLVFGMLHFTKEAYFSQTDRNFGPDNNKAIFPALSKFFVLKPVAPGSFYRLQYVYAEEGRYYTMQMLPVSGTDFDFRVPSKPGLYFYGSYDIVRSAQEGKPVDFSMGKKPLPLKKREMQALKTLYGYAKNTEWGPVIENRIEELKNEGIDEDDEE